MSDLEHLRHMAAVAANEDEDALLWALAEIERLRHEICTRSPDEAQAEIDRLNAAVKDYRKFRSAAINQLMGLLAEIEQLRAGRNEMKGLLDAANAERDKLLSTLISTRFRLVGLGRSTIEIDNAIAEAEGVNPATPKKPGHATNQSSQGTDQVPEGPQRAP